MHDVSNDVIPSQLKDLFIPTTTIHFYNAPSSVSNNFYMKKSKLTENHFQELVQNCGTRYQLSSKHQKLISKKEIHMIVFKTGTILLEAEDPNKDLESIISKVRKYPQ